MLLVAICVLLLGMVGCEPAEYNEYDTLEEVCEAAESSERVKVSGVLKLPTTVVEHDNRYRVLLVSALDQDKPAMTLMIKRGNGKNRMERLQEGYTYDDLIVHTADGRTVGHGDRVTISGKHLTLCMTDVYVIE
jgi:hypothetical protein